MESVDFVGRRRSGGLCGGERLSEDPKHRSPCFEAGGTGDNWVGNSPGAMILMIGGKVNELGIRIRCRRRAHGRMAISARQGARRLFRIQRHGSTFAATKRLRHWASLGIPAGHMPSAALLQALGGTRTRRDLSRQRRPAPRHRTYVPTIRLREI